MLNCFTDSTGGKALLFIPLIIILLWIAGLPPGFAQESVKGPTIDEVRDIFLAPEENLKIKTAGKAASLEYGISTHNVEGVKVSTDSAVTIFRFRDPGFYLVKVTVSNLDMEEPLAVYLTMEGVGGERLLGSYLISRGSTLNFLLKVSVSQFKTSSGSGLIPQLNIFTVGSGGEMPVVKLFLLLVPTLYVSGFLAFDLADKLRNRGASYPDPQRREIPKYAFLFGVLALFIILLLLT